MSRIKFTVRSVRFTPYHHGAKTRGPDTIHQACSYKVQDPRGRIQDAVLRVGPIHSTDVETCKGQVESASGRDGHHLTHHT
mgnify:CR=1 FL=1